MQWAVFFSRSPQFRDAPAFPAPEHLCPNSSIFSNLWRLLSAHSHPMGTLRLAPTAICLSHPSLAASARMDSSRGDSWPRTHLRTSKLLLSAAFQHVDAFRGIGMASFNAGSQMSCSNCIGTRAFVSSAAIKPDLTSVVTNRLSPSAEECLGASLEQLSCICYRCSGEGSWSSVYNLQHGRAQ